jgi:hypothetical protein
MSHSVLIVLMVVLFAICFSVIWRNIQQQKKPRRRFQVGRSRRGRVHPVRGSRVSYTDLARERRDSTPPPPPGKDTEAPPQESP